MAREVVSQVHAGSKDESVAGNFTLLGLAFKIAGRGNIVFEQPEHASIDELQQPHPDREYLRHDLEAVVERAENKPGFRQATLVTSRCARGNLPFGVVALI